MSAKRESFGGRMAVIFAMAGSAIGLGNIWRFPYIVGEYGGAAFVLAFVICSIFISMGFICGVKAASSSSSQYRQNSAARASAVFR